ncbi:hypothetical protein [Candidatus Oscillochloris fontis]|uniref:hypothetical protein n=1 Tax=Candidatus Oscillochloris fontis TaxID=2496868 RepID=UPI001375DF80|nr:hypothetical protein [Candidatus Oscillochloris fontis]
MRSVLPHLTHRHYLLAGIGYSVIALLIMIPILPVFASAIPGGPIAGVDGWQNVWNLWWVHQALSSGQNPFFSDRIFYPQGANLALQTLGLSNGIMVWPVTALWGPTAGYNAAVLLALVLTGVAGYALAIEVGVGRWVAFLAGLIYTCSPYHFTRIYDGQLELLTLQWPTFYALFLVRTLQQRQRRDALLAGLCLALTGYTSLYYLVFMAIFSLGVLLIWTWSPRQSLGNLVLLGGSALLLLLPLLLPALATATGENGSVVTITRAEVVHRSANLLDIGLPSYLHPIWGERLFVAVSHAWHGYSGDWNAALGYTVLGLALLGSYGRWRTLWRWWAIAGVALLFALGPELQIGPWRTGLPLPFVLFDLVPGLSLGRRPALFVALISLALIPPLAYGLERLIALRRSWLIVLVLLGVGFEFTPRPWPLHSASIHPIYRELAEQPGAILEIPPSRYKYSLPQLAQTVHGRPILGGYLARIPYYPWPDDAPILNMLWQMRLPDGPPLIDGMTDALVPLNVYGVGDLVVRWDQLNPNQSEAVRAVLASALPGVTPTYHDDRVSVYTIPQRTPRSFAGLVGDGWYPFEQGATTHWRWMDAQGEIKLVNPHSTSMGIRLSLRAHGYQGPREVRVLLDGLPVGVWQVAAWPTSAEFHLWLAPGEHRLRLEAPTVPEVAAASLRHFSIALLEAHLDIDE